MSIFLCIVAFVVWLVIQYKYEKYCQDAGLPLLTGRQYRYIRRKARRTGSSFNTVDYKPRTRQSPLFSKDWLGPNPLSSDATASPSTTQPSESQPPEKKGRVLLGMTVIAGIMLSSYLASKGQLFTPLAPVDTPPLTPQMTSSHVASPAPQPRVGRMKQTANVRGGPSNTADVLRTIPVGTAVQIVEARGSWVRVAVGDTAPIGWVYRPLVE